MPICPKRVDLAPNRGRTWIVKVIDTNLDAVAFVRFFGKAICKRRINQNTRLVVELSLSGFRQVSHLMVRASVFPLRTRRSDLRLSPQQNWKPF